VWSVSCMGVVGEVGVSGVCGLFVSRRREVSGAWGASGGHGLIRGRSVGKRPRQGVAFLVQVGGAGTPQAKPDAGPLTSTLARRCERILYPHQTW